MASLAVIAAQYTFLLFGWARRADSTSWLIVGAVVWIALMTWICYRGIELSARTQPFLLSAEIVIARALRGGRARQGLRRAAPPGSITSSASWFNPFALGCGALVDGVLLGIFIYWGWDSGVAVNEESRDRDRGPGQGRGRLDPILLLIYRRRQRRGAGLPRHRSFLANNSDDVLSALGNGVLRLGRSTSC